MFFWLKKVISFWLMPLPFCALLLAAGLWWWFRRGKTRVGRRLVFTSAFLLLFFCNDFVSDQLLRPLENRYATVPELPPNHTLPPPLARCQFVVILGGGNGNAVDRPALSLLSFSSLGRLTEGVRLLRLLPAAQLIVSGPGEKGETTHAARLAEAAVSLGIDRARIILIENGHDTEEEAREVAKRVGRAPVALVTSAWHLPRAMALFRRAGVDALPCPCDYKLKSGSPDFAALFQWSAESLSNSTWAVHERLGLLWLRLRGKS